MLNCSDIESDVDLQDRSTTLLQSSRLVGLQCSRIIKQFAELLFLKKFAVKQWKQGTASRLHTRFAGR